jgi:hypothetical protein
MPRLIILDSGVRRLLWTLVHMALCHLLLLVLNLQLLVILLLSLSLLNFQLTLLLLLRLLLELELLLLVLLTPNFKLLQMLYLATSCRCSNSNRSTPLLASSLSPPSLFLSPVARAAFEIVGLAVVQVGIEPAVVPAVVAIVVPMPSDALAPSERDQRP